MTYSADQRLKNVQVLRKEQRETTTIWVRDITGCLEEAPFAGEIDRRRINLEQTFLALTTEAGERLATARQQTAKSVK